MNKTQIAKQTKLHGKAVEALNSLVEFFTEQRDELQDKYDNRSDRWKDSDAGQEFQERLDTMSNATDSAQQALDEIEGMELPE